MAKLANVHPGDVLREEFIAPMGLSLRNVADASGLLHDDLTSLIEGRRPVDVDIARRLSQFSGTSIQFWVELQGYYDTENLQCKTSYLEFSDGNRDAVLDETAGPAEAAKTLGVIACGSDKSAGPLSRSSIPKGNLGRVVHLEPAYEEGHDE